MPKKLPDQPPKKKGGCFLKIILLIVGFLIFGRYLSFWGFDTFDIIHYLRPTMTFEQVMEMVQPLAPKGYQYPQPSEEARNRMVDCSVLYTMREFPRTTPLCLNMFQTSPEDITDLLTKGTYDRIVLYGERSVFDAPASEQGNADFITQLYQTVKFMDLISIPAFMKSYGLKDTSYIKDTRPYSYYYYRISTMDESDRMCDYGDAEQEKVQGCARGYFSSVIPISAVGPQLAEARPILRKTDNKRFSYMTRYPADCFTNDIFAHETSHMLNIAGQSETKGRVMDSWLTEQIAGLFSIYGADLACGEGTVTSQKKPNVEDVVKKLIEFNAVFAPAALSHNYPTDSTCKQALLTEWYTFLSKGNYRENFRKFFEEQRATTPSLVDDTLFAKLLLRLNPDSSVRTLLVSKGCTL